MAYILVVDDDEMICDALCDLFRPMGHDVDYALTLSDGLENIPNQLYDVVFLDVNLPDGNGVVAISHFRDAASSPEVVIITGEGTPDGAGLAIANALTALSGFLVAQYQNFADINMGIGIVLVGLGSVLIGDALINWLSIRGIWLQLAAIMAGCILFQLALAVALSMGVNPNMLKLITSVFVLSIVGIPRLLRRKEN